MSRMGTPVTYPTSEYLHTIVYRAPGFIVREGHYSPVVVQSTRGYRSRPARPGPDISFEIVEYTAILIDLHLEMVRR